MGRAGLTKQIIIDAALELVSECGIGQLTARALAAKLGVKAPSLYNHVESLDAVRSELAERALARLDKLLGHMNPSMSTRERLLEIAEAYRRFASNEPTLYQLMMWVPGSGNQDLICRGRKIVGHIGEVPALRNVSPTFRKHFTRAFHSAMHGFVMLEQQGFFAPDVSVDESYIRMLEPLIDMLEDHAQESDASGQPI